MTSDPRRGLPRLPLYYTLDQIAALLSLDVTNLIKSYVWFHGREMGVYKQRYLRAVNLNVGHREKNVVGRNPDDWRVPEGELLRWLTYNNLWIFDPEAQPEHYDRPISQREIRKLQEAGQAVPRYLVAEQIAHYIKSKSNITTEEAPHGGQ